MKPGCDAPIPCPYPGLRPFRASEAHLFFGRGAQVEELLSRLESRRFMAVVGSSGCGKSSLLRAGLIPALQAGFLSEAEGPWRIARMRPANAPFAQLARALLDEQALGPERAALPGAMGLLQATLRRGPEGLIEALDESALDPQTPLLLLVDQFEEIFRFRRDSDPNEADAFIRLLLSTARPGPRPLYVVLAMRSDFIGDCALFMDLPEAINDGQFLVPRLSRRQYQLAIEEPARLVGASLSPALVTQLLNDLRGEPDQLPVLQHALMRMWNRHESFDTPLGVSDYLAVGGLEQALAHHADQVLETLDDGQRALAQRLFRCLCERGEDQRDTRRPTRLGDIAASADVAVEQLTPVVEAFRSAGRSFLMPPPPEPLGGDTVVDISHESLIRRWRALSHWVDTESESATTYTRLADAADRHARGKAALWRMPDLQLALDWRRKEQPSAAWAARYGGDHAAAMAFLEASEAAWQQEQRQRQQVEAQRARRRLLVTASLTVLLVIAVLSSLWGWYSYNQAILAAREIERQRQDAEVQRSLVLSHQLNTQARQLRDNDTTLALLLGVEAVRAVDTEQYAMIAPVEEGLRETLALPDQRRLGEHRGRVAALAYSDLHGLLASAGDDGTVRLWRPQNKANEVHILKDHEQWVNAVAFSPLSGQLASGGDDGTVRLWDPQRPASPGRILGNHQGWVWSLAFSPSTGWLASGGADGVIRIWNPDLPGSEPLTLEGHQGGVMAVAFSTEGKWLVSAGADGTIRRWRSDNLQAPADILLDTEGWIWSLAFSPTTGQLAAGDEHGILRLWSMQEPGSNPTPVVLGSHNQRIYALAFSTDGQLLSAGESGALRLWETQQAGKSRLLHRGDTPFWSLALLADGRIASGSADGVIRSWQVADPVHEPQILDAHEDSVNSVAISADWLASGSRDGSVRLWPGADPQALPVVLGNPDGDWINAVAISPEQRWLAAGDSGSRIRLWRLADLQATPRTLDAHDDWINALAFSPDGKLLASSAADGSALIWSLDDADVAPQTLQTVGSVWINALAFSPDGKLLASGDTENNLQLWSLSDVATPVQILRGHRDWVNSVAFSPDGRLLASGAADNTVRLWQLADTNALPVVLRAHNGWVQSVAFSPDGTLLASAGADNTLRLWRLPQPDRPVTLRGHKDWVTQLAFSADGTQLVSASDDTTLRLWRVHLDALLDLACRRAGRNLGWEEWQWYLGNMPYRPGCAEFTLTEPLSTAMLTSGDELATRGDRAGAIAIYQQLLDLGYQGELDPARRADTLATSPTP